MALLTQNQKILLKVARAYGRTRADRDDLVSEMTAALWKSFGRFDDRYPFSTWAYRISLNVAISFYRSERRRTERPFVDVDARADCNPDAGEPDERIERLNAFIAGLGELDKALMLLYLDEHPYKGIAAILGLTETNVATKLFRLKVRAKIALLANS